MNHEAAKGDGERFKLYALRFKNGTADDSGYLDESKG
jgi:hypothetical protein